MTEYVENVKKNVKGGGRNFSKSQSLRKQELWGKYEEIWRKNEEYEGICGKYEEI